MSDQDYPWNVLGIEETDDKKTIKKAYAVLLKQYKPDEHPDEFQKIQQAYKMALTSLHNNHQLSISEKHTETLIKHQPETFNLTDKQIDVKDEIFNQQKQQQALIDNLYAQIHVMAFEPLVVKSKVENWHFIEDYYKIEEMALKDEVAKTIFKKVAEYNQFQLKENKRLLIDPIILNYLDSIFDWDEKWNDYQHEFPDHYFKVTLDPVNHNVKPESWINSMSLIAKRSLGLSLDMLFFIGFLYLIDKLLLRSEDFSPNILSYMLYLIASETLFKNRLSLGNEILNMVVLNQYGNICSKLQSVSRNLIFFLTVLIPIYVLLKINLSDYTIFYIYFSIVLLIYAIVFLLTKKLLQDILTKTIVVRQ